LNNHTKRLPGIKPHFTGSTKELPFPKQVRRTRQRWFAEATMNEHLQYSSIAEDNEIRRAQERQELN